MPFAMLGRGRGIATVVERPSPGEARLHPMLRLAVPPVRRSPRTLRSRVVYRMDSLRYCGFEPDCTVANR